MSMITEQDIEYFIETVSDLERAILDINTFNADLNDYYLTILGKFSEFQRAFKFKVLPETTKSFNTVKQHISEFLVDINALLKDPSLKQYKLFMHKIYYDIKMISLELQTIQINLNTEKPTLDLLIKFPYWLIRHQQNGDFYNYAWVYDIITEIENDAPRFFSLFANEFNEMRDLAMNSNIPESEKKQRMDELVQLMVSLSQEMIRSSID
jgi:hypothetical protein